ncbi:laccase-21-like isoform X2 [Punica granatum]|uniref:Laccase n=1 Tax=Punica granatum TaxID=22663 RepID=A0A6P8DJK4_PUNGR|nr:laccase-21-like isoform X2 [Punica granatum]
MSITMILCLQLKETNLTRLCLNKTVMTVNDSFPGPVISVHRGDTAYVNLHNHADFGITIHWHGVKQPRNPWSDGPVYITQCPIEPGKNFTYEIIFTREIGTLWWHAHSDWTRATVHGAIVILPSEGMGYPFPEPDGEEVVVISSWHKVDIDPDVEEEDTIEDIALPSSSAYTINGQPGDFCNCSKESTYHWLVDPGKTYLIHLVNGVMDVEMFFAIGHHNLTVVGMDGSYVKPLDTSYVMISPGQTMDILVTTNQPAGRYYMAARQFDTERPDIQADTDRQNATAILQYTGSYPNTSVPYFPAALPTYGDLTAGYSFRSRIRSLASKEYPIDVPKNITTHMYVVAAVDYIYRTNESGTTNVTAASLNNASWWNPPLDILMAYYRNVSGIYTADFPDKPPNYYNFAADELPDLITTPATKVKVLDYNEEVEIVLQGTDGIKHSTDHPMHLHGYAFYVVGYGHGNFNNETDPLGFNLIDPPEQNTVSLPKQGWTAIRFRASNPGVWLWHCHFDKHYTWGMNTVFIVKNGGTPETSVKGPPAYMPPCKSSALRLQKAGNSISGNTEEE